MIVAFACIRTSIMCKCSKFGICLESAQMSYHNSGILVCAFNIPLHGLKCLEDPGLFYFVDQSR